MTLDLVLTVSGIGNLLKLRHLLKLTKLGRLALYANEGISATDIIVYKIGMATIEIAPTVAQYYVNFQLTGDNGYCDVTSPNYDAGKCQWYREFSNWLLLIQIKSGVIEGTHQLLLRKSAKRLLDDPGRIPNTFNTDALNTLRLFGYDLTSLELQFREFLKNKLGTYNSDIWQKYMGLPSDNMKAAFIFDFEDANLDTLLKLNENGGELVDYWTQIKKVKSLRKKVNYLEAYRNFKSNPDHYQEFIKHVCYGVKAKKNPIMKGGHMASQANGDNLRLKNGATIESLPTDENGVIIVNKSIGLEKKRIKPDGSIVWDSKDIDYDEPHTFFPIDWDEDMIFEQFISALISSKKSSYNAKSNAFRAVSESGIEFGWWVQNGVSTTCFPIPKTIK